MPLEESFILLLDNPFIHHPKSRFVVLPCARKKVRIMESFENVLKMLCYQRSLHEHVWNTMTNITYILGPVGNFH